jgi:thiosulfate/3-mercaptopyruvate sulfurtransferase
MNSRTSFRRIGAGEASAVLARDDVVILDVRAADAFAEGHMAGARHTTMADLSEVLNSTPKTAPILVYCYHGNASQEFAKILTDFRFQEVYSLDGGFEGWAQSPSHSR